MKNLFKTAFVLLVAMISMETSVSAQTLKNLLKQTKSSTTKTTVSAAFTQGQNAGTALKALYDRYKLDGKKLNMGNATNILNAAALASSVKNLKSSDRAYKTDYAKGLISGSKNLVKESNSSSVISGLTSFSELDLTSLTKNTSKSNKVAKQVSGTIENASSIASSLSSILDMFK